MKNQAAVLLGSIRSEKKAQASRENGKLGGRPAIPRPYPPVPPGFIQHPKWDKLAANAAGDIVRLFLHTSNPYWRPSKNSIDSKGYYFFRLPGPRGTGWVRCHRIVYECHHGKVYAWTVRGEGLTIDHINGNKLDNRIENLQILTSYQNMIKSSKKYDLPRYIHKCGSGLRWFQITFTLPGRVHVYSKAYRTLSEAMQNYEGFLKLHGKAMPKETTPMSDLAL